MPIGFLQFPSAFFVCLQLWLDFRSQTATGRYVLFSVTKLLHFQKHCFKDTIQLTIIKRKRFQKQQQCFTKQAQTAPVKAPSLQIEST